MGLCYPLKEDLKTQISESYYDSCQGFTNEGSFNDLGNCVGNVHAE